MKDIKFTENLVKGKIAEIIFEQMLRETDKFIILRFGYEYILPELTRDKEYKNSESIEAIRQAPDFAIINKSDKKVHLIEVKYRRKFNKSYILKIVQRMNKSWNPSSLFIASRDGFYFGDVDKILKNKGVIPALNHPYIPKKLQDKYLKLLIKYEQ